MGARTVLLVESSPIFQQALISVLRRLGFEVSLSSQPETRVPSGNFPAVLLDIATHQGDRHDLQQLIQSYLSLGPILLLAREDRIEEVVAGLKAGASGFLKQSASSRELRDAIMAVARGRVWCDRDLFREVVRFLSVRKPSHPPRLSQRDTDVLLYISRGQTNKEIAQRLGVSEQSVKVYVSNLLRKTGASGRSRLAAYAILWGLSG